MASKTPSRTSGFRQAASYSQCATFRGHGFTEHAAGRPSLGSITHRTSHQRCLIRFPIPMAAVCHSAASSKRGGAYCAEGFSSFGCLASHSANVSSSSSRASSTQARSCSKVGESGMGRFLVRGEHAKNFEAAGIVNARQPS